MFGAFDASLKLVSLGDYTVTNAASLAAALDLGHSQQQRSEEKLDFLLGLAILCMRPASSAVLSKMVTCAANP